MSRIQIAWDRNTSAVLLAAALGGIVTAACSSSDSGNGGNTAGTSAAQAGTGGSSAQAGTSSAGTVGQSGSATTGGSSAGGTAPAGGSMTTGGTSGGESTGGSGGTTSAGTGGGGGSGGSVDVSKLDKFSFFVTSMAAMIKLSKSQDGFGGDLRYGTDSGLKGADKICTEIAESSMPGSGAKEWHAFLSTVNPPVNAKDRIGTGPWYDRTGRVVAMTLNDLLQNRPGADAAIKEDLPNETGTGNHRPNPNAPEDDNHHTLTGSKADGTLYGQTATCMDWTTTSKDNKTTGRPRIGFSWSTGNRTNWISGQDEGGCGAGITGVGTENGGSDPNNPIVGSGGGYGGIYCFAMKP